MDTQTNGYNSGPIDLLWGAESIAREIGVNRRQCFHLLETGLIPGRKIGGRWVVTRARLREFFCGDGQHVKPSGGGN
jgi:hypothetical protein